jgi:fluoride exporter
MNPILLTFLGGGTGAVARYLVGVGWGRVGGHVTPWLATLLINVLGGLLMGVLISCLALRAGGDQERWRLLLGVGVLGGFTTFSTFSLETVMMIQRKAWLTAAGYVSGSVILSIAGVMTGLYLTRKVLA